MYKTIGEVEHPIEGAVVVVAAKFAVQSIKDLMEKGAKWITLVTGGFAESKTKEGKDAQVSMILFFNCRMKLYVLLNSITAVLLDLTVWVSMILIMWILYSFLKLGK